MKNSIHRHVLLWVMGTLAAGAALLIAASWLVLTEEMGEVFEDNLKQVALAVAHHGAPGTGRALQFAEELPKVYSEYGKFEFVTAVWTPTGALLQTSDASVRLPFLSRSGLTVVAIGKEKWQLYTIVLADAIVQTAQRSSEREALARETASTLVLPAVALLALIAWLLTLALRRGLAPLAEAARDVSARSAETLHPIALASHPQELHLLVGAVNDLMGRLGAALVLQRHFLADAAHELRTPITALRLQLQLLERAADGAQRAAAQNELRSGIDRSQQLVEQLLQLSRLAPEAPTLRREPVELGALVRSAVSRFSARAEARRVDLGAISQPAPLVAGDAAQLTILINNLVDNALRHTPDGGRIDVGVQQQDGRACLVVNDSGAGIAPAERQRVFDRFYRVGNQTAADTVYGSAYGSGLGLAIVKAVAERHGASVLLDDAPTGGLRVTVCFPPA